jgi:hypothetical protein
MDKKFGFAFFSFAPLFCSPHSNFQSLVTQNREKKKLPFEKKKNGLSASNSFSRRVQQVEFR